MKTDPANGRRSRSGRDVLIIFITVATVTVAMLLPVYHAHLAAQTMAAGQSLTARLIINPDGSATVSFNGIKGALYQIYNSEILAASPETMQWTLAVDDLLAHTNGSTVWIDSGDTNRPRPGAVRQRFYRIALKSNPPASNTPQPLVPDTSTFSGRHESLGSHKRREIAQATQLKEALKIRQLIIDGGLWEAKLLEKLSRTRLNVRVLLELARSEEGRKNWQYSQLLYETIIGSKSGRTTDEQLALAHFGLGNIYGRDFRHSERFMMHYFEAIRLAPNTETEWVSRIGIGNYCRENRKFAEARHCWGETVKRGGTSQWREHAQWLIGITYREEGNFEQALKEFAILSSGFVDCSQQARAQYSIAGCLQEMGRLEEAKAAYLKIQEMRSRLPADLPTNSFTRWTFDQAIEWSRFSLAQIDSKLKQMSGD
jgi:tetratricopeptide (TPR) repeat protein